MIPEGLEFTEVDSSSIASVAHDGSRLFVQFTNGAVYAYKAPKEEFDAILNAPSAGRYHAANIKHGYEYERIA